jgi:hypothetical protein
MAAYVKYFQFVEDILQKVHDLFGTDDSASADDCKIMLSNTAGDVAQTLATRSQVTEIANGNGYTTGGISVHNIGTRASGTVTVSGTKAVWTSAGAGMAQFRYVILYNDTPVSPADPLIASWDYGSALTLAVGETFTVKFNSGDPTGTIFTLA